MARLAALTWMALLVAIGAPASGHERFYIATLSGAAEFPANDSPGSGSVVVTVNLDLASMRVQAQFSGLEGNVTAAHIHGSTDFPLQGLADVATQMPTFQGFPAGVASGTYDATFSLANLATYNPAYVNATGGTVDDAYNDFVQSLNSATMYFNIHTTARQGGEIRGFLLPTPSADFDHSGRVDQSDLGPWSAALRVDPTGDANSDALSDGTDFLIWQNQFGELAGVGAPGHGHISSVPEPTTASTAGAWLGAVCFLNRKKCGVFKKRFANRPALGQDDAVESLLN